MEKDINNGKYLLTVLIVKLLPVVLIIIAVIAVKFLNADFFNELRGFYISRFCADTSVYEVIDDDCETFDNAENIVDVKLDVCGKPNFKTNEV